MKKNELRLHGALTALVTPFREDGGVDEKALASLVAWQIESGIHGLVPCGTTGEGATLAPDEHARVIELVVAGAAGRVPVVAGCGTNDTRTTLAAAERAAKAGADALLVVTPYYNKPNRSGMIAHFAAVADAAGLPIVPYNVPGRTGQNLGAELILRLAEIPGVVAVKEAAGNVEQLATIVEGARPGFAVLSGDDAIAFPEVCLGAAGVVSVVSNVAPAPAADMMTAALRGDVPAARALHYRLLPLIRALFLETNPVPAKTALAMLGRCRDVLRPPLGPPEGGTRHAIEQALRHAGLLVGAV
ncbi:MAG TPA: 4-hydroxy-tetrahydrodipicolinate synthase [Candidatus Polarisedimenticolaceae bacterium]|nr:4-hydroxy-tetrahydrodipicolinate synthase [Candidatus Polarisedimenticolaceae bacterium]